MSNETNTLEEAEQAAAAKLERFWHNAELANAIYPVGTDAVLAMVDGNGYVCDRGLLLELVDSRQIPVEREGGSLRWTAMNVFHLICQLEGRRRWNPHSPLHRFKFNAAELSQLDAEAAGDASFIADLDKFDVEFLLIIMQDSEDQSVRELIRVAILTKLQQRGAL